MRAITADLAQLKTRQIEEAARRQLKAGTWGTGGGAAFRLRRVRDTLRETLTEEVETYTLRIRKSLKDFARS